MCADVERAQNLKQALLNLNLWVCPGQRTPLNDTVRGATRRHSWCAMAWCVIMCTINSKCWTSKYAVSKKRSRQTLSPGVRGCALDAVSGTVSSGASKVTHEKVTSWRLLNLIKIKIENRRRRVFKGTPGLNTADLDTTSSIFVYGWRWFNNLSALLVPQTEYQLINYRRDNSLKYYVCTSEIQRVLMSCGQAVTIARALRSSSSSSNTQQHSSNARFEQHSYACCCSCCTAAWRNKACMCRGSVSRQERCQRWHPSVCEDHLWKRKMFGKGA